MKRLAILVATLALLAAACGGGDDDTSAAGGKRTIKIEMKDIEFSPDSIDVKTGETIRFEFENNGKVAHDAFIGDEAAQADHEDKMNGGMSGDMTDTSGMDHAADADANGITVDPGKSGEITHTFDTPGTVLIGCHQPGHYKSGMKVTVDVT